MPNPAPAYATLIIIIILFVQQFFDNSWSLTMSLLLLQQSVCFGRNQVVYTAALIWWLLSNLGPHFLHLNQYISISASIFII